MNGTERREQILNILKSSLQIVVMSKKAGKDAAEYSRSYTQTSRLKRN